VAVALCIDFEEFALSFSQLFKPELPFTAEIGSHPVVIADSIVSGFQERGEWSRRRCWLGVPNPADILDFETGSSADFCSFTPQEPVGANYNAQVLVASFSDRTIDAFPHFLLGIPGEVWHGSLQHLMTGQLPVSILNSSLQVFFQRSFHLHLDLPKKTSLKGYRHPTERVNFTWCYERGHWTRTTAKDYPFECICLEWLRQEYSVI